MMDRTGAYMVLMGKSKKRSLRGRCRHRWETNIEMDLQDIWEGVNWISVAQDREKWQAVVSVAMNLWFHKMREISSLSEELLASQEVLNSMEFFH
jgi:hypothetical protein